MYRLADEIGEDAVNRALRSLLAKYAFKGAPYPTALDLVAALRAQAPADKQGLITDLFEKITLYDLKATAAAARPRPDGRYDVTLTVTAAKVHADGTGKETPAPMNETVDVGLFAAKPGAAGFGPRASDRLRETADPIGRADPEVHHQPAAQIRRRRSL